MYLAKTADFSTEGNAANYNELQNEAVAAFTKARANLNKRELNIGDVASIQNLLNLRANAKSFAWQQDRSIDDFVVETFMEFAELTESTPHKWWSAGSVREFNAKIEVIDMLHFVASELILDFVVPKPEPRFHHRAPEDRLDENIFNLPIACPHTSDSRYAMLTRETQDDGTERISFSSKATRKIASRLIDGRVESKFAVISNLCQCFNMDNEAASALYVAKAELNAIRWEKGYFLDTYKKLKACGREDNAYLENVLNWFLDNPNIKLSEIAQRVRDVIHEADAALQVATTTP